MEIYERIDRSSNPTLLLLVKILSKYNPTDFFNNTLMYYLFPNENLNLNLKSMSKISIKLESNYCNDGELREYFKKNNLSLAGNKYYYFIEISEAHNIKGERGAKDCIDNGYILKWNKDNKIKLLKILDYLLGEFK